METLWDGIGILSQKLTIWPDPRHLLAEGSKLFYMKIITEASASLGYSYPRCLRINPTNKDIQGITDGRLAAVIKRGYSHQGQHVYTPHTSEICHKFGSALRDERLAYRNDSQPTRFPKPVWFMQPYIPALLYLGEIKTFIINGTLFNSVVTTPKNLSDVDLPDIQHALLFTPLSKLR